MRKIVLDIETKNIFQEVGGRGDPTKLDISLLVTYDFQTDQYECFLEEDFPRLWKLLEESDMIIGYNSDHFDIPLLNKYYEGDLTAIKSLDLLSEIKNTLGRRLRLDSVAEGTLGIKKSGDGLEAVKWWRQGEIEKLKRYCKDDVRITKEIYEFALKNNFLKYKDYDGIKTIPLKTENWEDPGDGALNHTLLF
ncbi:MAG: ribonuclease H-like domain-containing protein [Candidatus Paceibacterota bacterium]